jgi:hypothetical protein
MCMQHHEWAFDPVWACARAMQDCVDHTTFQCTPVCWLVAVQMSFCLGPGSCCAPSGDTLAAAVGTPAQRRQAIGAGMVWRLLRCKQKSDGGGEIVQLAHCGVTQASQLACSGFVFRHQ